jgi:ATP-dependent RNA helicase DDX46/PRP5
VRRKVTLRSNLDDIVEATGCTIGLRGTYIPPNKKPEVGDRRLHLQIQGSSEMAVRQARMELTRQLEEETLKFGAANASGGGGGGGGRYSVI